MLNLKGKRILLFIPKFFGLSKQIETELKNLGAEVDAYNERSISSALNRALLKVIPFIFKFHTYRYYKNILNSIKNNKYDYILFVDCQMADAKALSMYRSTFLNSKFILYLWDSLANLKNTSSKFEYFDKVLSFDRMDCVNNSSICFRPLFYSTENNNTKTVKPKYDISFVGTIHSDRYAIIKKISKICNDNNYKLFVFKYLQSNFIYYFYKASKSEFRDTKHSDFSYKAIPSSEVQRISSESKAILDINNPKQDGLTTRPIEALYNGKKLITTCSDIENYDFYNSNDILIIDRSNPMIIKNFIETPFKPISAEIMNHYSFENWAKDVFS